MGCHRAIRPFIGHLHRQRRIAEQDVVAVLERHLHRAFNQQRLEAGAIDEQVAFDLACLRGLYGANVAILVHQHLLDIRQNVPHTQRFATMALDERREFARVEMIGIVGEGIIFSRRNRLGGQAVVADAALRADAVAETFALIACQPMRGKVHLPEILREHQGMIIAVIDRAGGPAVEACALFESGIAFAEKIGLRHAHAR